MQNNISGKILTIIFVLTFSIFSSQCKKVNLLIMIDEKPALVVNDFYILSSFEESMKVKYSVGTINLDDENYTKLLNDKSQNITLNFESLLASKTFASKYAVEIPKSFLNQDYIIVNIFNMDNKKYKKKYLKTMQEKKDYYIVVETPNSMKFSK